MDGFSKKQRFMLFAGTTEGRVLSLFMSENGIPTSIYTATEYGAEVLRSSGVDKNPGSVDIHIHAGRLDETAIKEEISNQNPIAVIDATHPFAEEASRIIQKCCDDSQTVLLKVLRPKLPLPEGGMITRTKNVSEAADYLSGKKGNILLTIGTRRIDTFCEVFLQNLDAASRAEALDRICVRILPVMDSIKTCTECGLKRRNIIAAEGPFTEEMNLSCIHHFDASFLVTKETGIEGGLPEKISAARKAGIEVVTIIRPESTSGISMVEAKQKILALWNNR